MADEAATPLLAGAGLLCYRGGVWKTVWQVSHENGNENGNIDSVASFLDDCDHDWLQCSITNENHECTSVTACAVKRQADHALWLVVLHNQYVVAATLG